MAGGEKRKPVSKWLTIAICVTCAIYFGFRSLLFSAVAIQFLQMSRSTGVTPDARSVELLAKAFIHGSISGSIAAGFVIYLVYWLKKNSN